MATTARRGSCNHLDAIPSKKLEPRIVRKAVLRKPVDENSLVGMTKEKLVLEEKGTQEPVAALSAAVSSERKKTTALSATVSSERKKKTAISATVSAQKKKIGGKSLEQVVSYGTKKPLPKRILKDYMIEMDEEEYENLEVFKLHTCTPACREYSFSCETKRKAVESHFKEFMERTLGRSSSRRLDFLYAGYIFFNCYLSDEEVEILKGQKSVVEIKLLDFSLGGHDG